MGENKMRILVIDDHDPFGELARKLSYEGSEVTHVQCGRAGVELAMGEEHDLIIIDPNLPDGDGFELVQALRVNWSVTTPILMISRNAGVAEKVRGLRAGADDFMTKPMHFEELFARVKAVVRRSTQSMDSIITCGEITINLGKKIVEIEGVGLHLTGKEYEVLELLATRKGATVSKAMFLEQLYSGLSGPGAKILDVFICKLRKKLSRACGGRNYIATIWGRGYMLQETNTAEIYTTSMSDRYTGVPA